MYSCPKPSTKKIQLKTNRVFLIFSLAHHVSPGRVASNLSTSQQVLLICSQHFPVYHVTFSNYCQNSKPNPNSNQLNSTQSNSMQLRLRLDIVSSHCQPTPGVEKIFFFLQVRHQRQIFSNLVFENIFC